MRVPSFLKTYKTEVALFTGAFLVRLLYAGVVQFISGPEGFIAFSDAEFFYYRLAHNLIDHQAFSLAVTEPYYPNAFHTPLYPLFLSFLFVLKVPLFGVAVIQAILGAAIALLAYKIGTTLTDRTVALFAAVLVALEPMSLYWGGLLMSDLFFAFWMMFSFWALIRGRYQYSALTLGLAALTRPIALLFLPAYLFFIAYTAYTGSKDLRSSLKKSMLILVVFAAVVSPWLARNKIVFDTWEFTSAGWYDLYMYPVTVFASERNIPLASVATAQDPLDFSRFDFKYAPLYKQASFDVISVDMPGFLVFQTMRSLGSLFTDRYEYLIQTVLPSAAPSLYGALSSSAWGIVLVLGRLFWLAVYALALFALLQKRLLPVGLFFLCLVLINAGVSGGINPGGSDMSRYSISFLAFFFIFAAEGARLAWGRLSRFI